MTPHSHHSMQSHLHGNHTNHHHHHPNSQSTPLLSSGNQANPLARSNGMQSANLSPSEYTDCMERSSNHAFEVNCFGGIGNVNIHPINDDLHYMQEFGKSHNHNHHLEAATEHNVAANSHAGAVLLNGNANSGGSVLFNGNDLHPAHTISDSIQYTSVIVEPNNFHMTNEYVH